MDDLKLLCEGLERVERKGPTDSLRIMSRMSLRLRKNAEYLLEELEMLTASEPRVSVDLSEEDRQLLSSMISLSQRLCRSLASSQKRLGKLE